ncbi:aurachin C monooxygenase/isomerase-like, partial [Convolutriloba macropyga]|uniref:aurachin C monooxygenase/isomerase-like n=1 Tax=Convolutriloba macropyga TaxID=536237 RepID=UPI003F51CF20
MADKASCGDITSNSRRALKVLVVGGSIGGLSTGLSLIKAGFPDVQVFERSPGPLNRGAGVGIDDVAMAVLRRLVADSVEGSSLLSGKLQPMRLLEERSAQGHNVLLRTDPYPYQAVYWEDIYNLLLTAFKEAGGVVHFGSKAVGTEQAEDCRGEFSGKAVTVSFEDGSSTSGDVLIAADGPRSRIYADSFPDTQPMKYLG